MLFQLSMASFSSCLLVVKKHIFHKTSWHHGFMSTEIGEHMLKHGDGVKDVAFVVEDVDAIFKVGHTLFVFAKLVF